MKRTIREACRRRMPLDGTDAECLEYALAQAERDRDTAIARAEAAEDREERLREALREQERLWRSLPSGVDEEADPDDRSPEDVFAWTAGIAVRAIRAVLSKIYRCSGCGAYLSEKDVGPGGVGHAVTRYINGVPEPDLCGPCIEQKPEAEGRTMSDLLFDPLHTVTSKARFGIVTIGGQGCRRCVRPAPRRWPVPDREGSPSVASVHPTASGGRQPLAARDTPQRTRGACGTTKGDEMKDDIKDRIGEVCDERDWRVEYHDDGCTIETHNGSVVEYHYDDNDRTMDLRAKGRMATIVSVLSLLNRIRTDAAAWTTP